MNMIEKLCRAAAGGYWDFDLSDDESSKILNRTNYVNECWKNYRSEVLAILQALQEPDEGMIEAAKDVEMLSNCDGDPTADVPNNREIFRVMIQSILDQAQ